MNQQEKEAYDLACRDRDQWAKRALDAEDKLAEISASFMRLHNIAKDVVGPKHG